MPYTVSYYSTRHGEWMLFLSYETYSDALDAADALRRRGDHAHVEETSYLDIVGFPKEAPGQPGSLLYRDCACPACRSEFTKRSGD